MARCDAWKKRRRVATATISMSTTERRRLAKGGFCRRKLSASIIASIATSRLAKGALYTVASIRMGAQNWPLKDL